MIRIVFICTRPRIETCVVWSRLSGFVYFHGPCRLALTNSGLAPSCADATSSNVFALVPPYLAVLSYDTAPESIRKLHKNLYFGMEKAYERTVKPDA